MSRFVAFSFPFEFGNFGTTLLIRSRFDEWLIIESHRIISSIRRYLRYKEEASNILFNLICLSIERVKKWKNENESGLVGSFLVHFLSSTVFFWIYYRCTVINFSFDASIQQFICSTINTAEALYICSSLMGVFSLLYFPYRIIF